MRYLLILLLMLIIFNVAVTLSVRNDHLVIVNYLFSQGQYRISSLFTILFTTGFIIGCLICGIFWIKAQIELIYAKRKIKHLKNQNLSKDKNCSSKI